VTAARSKTYFWDFFGPRAGGTAQHFQKHLDEFLDKNAIAGCETGLCSEGAGHQAVFCRATREAEPAIEGALRPRRMTDDAPPTGA
jgi:uncharacterized protein